MSHHKNDEVTENQSSINTSATEGEEIVNDFGNNEAGNDLQAQLAAKTAESEEHYSRMLRLQADFENFRRRSQKEREDFVKYAVEGLVNNLLPVLDNFERALSNQEDQGGNFKTGVEMIFRQFKEALEAEGVKAIEAVGCEFDPNCHQAVMQVASDEHEDNIVIEEFQKGYLLKEKVIRPAMVKVAKN